MNSNDAWQSRAVMETDYVPSDGDDTHADNETAPLVTIWKEDSSSNYYRITVLLLCGLLTVVADFGGSLTAAPEVRLLEMTVCRAFYELRDPRVIGPPPLGYVEESLCKVADIQVSLAYLRAWKRCLDSIPGLFLTLPFGRLADRWGRKPVLMLCVGGQILAYAWLLIVCYFYDIFSPKAIWFGSIFLALGGGSRMLTAVLNSIIVDVCAEEKRSVVFYVFGAAIHITDIVALPLGSWFLSQDLWLPFKFCSPMMLLSFAIILLLPETMPSSLNSSLASVSRQGRQRTQQPKPIRQRKIVDALNGLYDRVRRDSGTLGWFALIFLHSFAIQSGPLLLQFASKRLEWTLAQAGYLLSIRAVCAILVLIVLVPAANALVSRKVRYPHQESIDIVVCRLSLLLLAMGNMITGFSTSGIIIVVGTIIVSLGIPFPQAMQGILGDIAQREGTSTASLYAGQALTELAGASLGTLSMATIFDFGTHFGEKPELGLGMPFWASAALFTVAFFASHVSSSALGIGQMINLTTRRDE